MNFWRNDLESTKNFYILYGEITWTNPFTDKDE